MVVVQKREKKLETKYWRGREYFITSAGMRRVHRPSPSTGRLAACPDPRDGLRSGTMHCGGLNGGHLVAKVGGH